MQTSFNVPLNFKDQNVTAEEVKLLSDARCYATLPNGEQVYLRDFMRKRRLSTAKDKLDVLLFSLPTEYDLVVLDGIQWRDVRAAFSNALLDNLMQIRAIAAMTNNVEQVIGAIVKKGLPANDEGRKALEKAVDDMMHGRDPMFRSYINRTYNQKSDNGKNGKE